MVWRCPITSTRSPRFNVDHVTITINMVDPEIGAKIYPWIFWKHKRYTGVEAAKILTDRQLQGLEMLTERGILCKVNSVMIPGINDKHLVEVNRAVKSRGAFLHNIMPLISAPEHGTVFGLTGQRGPTAQELKALQDSCEGEMNMMRHCRQCRADAVGLLGEDRSAEFTTDKIMAMEVNYDLEIAQGLSGAVEGERQAKVAAKQAELETLAARGSDIKMLVAVATKGCGRINEHFGHAKEFQVYELSTAGAKFVGHRRVDLYCQGGFGEEDSLETVIRAINDCHAVFVAKIGGCPKDRLHGGRHRAGRPVCSRIHREIRDRLVQRLSRQGEKRRDRARRARRRRNPPGRASSPPERGRQDHLDRGGVKDGLKIIASQCTCLLGLRGGMPQCGDLPRKTGHSSSIRRNAPSASAISTSPQCVAVCPVDNTCVIDNAFPRYQPAA